MSGTVQITCSFLLLVACFILLANVPWSSAEEDVPPPKFSNRNLATPTLRFLYCYSCGYKKAFDEYASIIQTKYPHMMVDGRNYDPPGINMFIARMIGILKIAVIMCILASIQVFNYINLPQPSWWQWCLDNKMYASLMLFFLCNLLEGQLIQSGAFEISLNDVPVWSKLETGRIPQPPELFTIIDSHLQFADSILDS